MRVSVIIPGFTPNQAKGVVCCVHVCLFMVRSCQNVQVRKYSDKCTLILVVEYRYVVGITFCISISTTVNSAGHNKCLCS